MQSECCGVHDGSPYKYENPMQYFENTASKRGSRIDGFNPEYGTPCLPIYESLKEISIVRLRFEQFFESDFRFFKIAFVKIILRQLLAL